ncbi:uncharacterized protein BJ212DRAFT_1392832 [Suillus subaureus]|uniref:Uncharacterized protein n=1 Tax=Suillus subaureus TaxID=48587 RepID=A0A9P7DWS9_9AGAM|nr:uncharacterized protein BJ212DRAFT_1392832 [Suillus subaureus]KAG1805219.1 hypothetical protein BJ212DRAFT_1392832 [Suillus subaureus]
MATIRARSSTCGLANIHARLCIQAVIDTGRHRAMTGYRYSHRSSPLTSYSSRVCSLYTAARAGTSTGRSLSPAQPATSSDRPYPFGNS